MRIEQISTADALEQLSRVERSAQSEMPTFIAAPRALDTRTVDDEIRVIYECDDSANDATYIVEVPYGTQPPRTSQQNSERLAECSVAALETAERIARAVFN